MAVVVDVVIVIVLNVNVVVIFIYIMSSCIIRKNSENSEECLYEYTNPAS